jgi:hypothetical protein
MSCPSCTVLAAKHKRCHRHPVAGTQVLLPKGTKVKSSHNPLVWMIACVAGDWYEADLDPAMAGLTPFNKLKIRVDAFDHSLWVGTNRWEVQP